MFTYKRDVPTVQYVAVVGGASVGAEHAGVGAAAVEPDRQQVALRVVGHPVIHYLQWRNSLWTLALPLPAHDIHYATRGQHRATYSWGKSSIKNVCGYLCAPSQDCVQSVRQSGWVTLEILVHKWWNTQHCISGWAM